MLLPCYQHVYRRSHTTGRQLTNVAEAQVLLVSDVIVNPNVRVGRAVPAVVQPVAVFVCPDEAEAEPEDDHNLHQSYVSDWFSAHIGRYSPPLTARPGSQ